jgi:tetratricopeptide (TPR) repeat protein
MKYFYLIDKEDSKVYMEKWYLRIVGGLLFSAIVVFALFSLMNGCATVPPKPTVSPERQKAIQDSLRKIWDRQLNIAWSTGYENHKNKLYRDAIRPFWRVVELDTVKRFPDLYTFLGDCYLKLNQPDSAEIVYRLGTIKYPDKAFYHRSLAWLLAGHNQSEEAIKQYRQAIALDPNVAADYKALGGLLVAANQTTEARPVYQKLVELDPSDQDAQKILSQIQSALGDVDAALKTMENALANDPNNTTLLMNLGETYFKEQEYQKAIQHLTTLTQLNPDELYALELLGYSYQNLGQFKSAIAVYDKILAKKADHKKIICEMATCFKELQQYARARSVVNQALKIDNTYGLAYIVRGEIYEACADDCISQRAKKISKFDDKLVYKMAYDEYTKAANDVQFSDEAKKKLNYVQPEIPTKEDIFMNKNKKQADMPCYSWIY